MLIKKIFRICGIPAITVSYQITESNKLKCIYSLPFENITIPVIPLFTGRESITHYDQKVYAIKNGKVFGTYTIATATNSILWDLTRWHQKDKATNPYAYHFLSGKTKKINGTVAVITSNDSDRNYHHWITTALPKFRIIQQSGRVIDKYIIDTTRSYHQESIDLLGIKNNQIIPSDPQTYIQAENLICTNNSTLYGFIQPWVKQFLWDLFLPIESSTNTRKIYIKRTTNRKIENAEEFENLLERFGFEILTMEGLKVTQQAKIFNEAAYVIGPHGAGLTNIVFCKPGTKVIEIFHPNTVFGHYYAMSGSCGLQYFPYVGEQKNNPQMIDMDNDINVQIEELKDFLGKILQ